MPVDANRAAVRAIMQAIGDRDVAGILAHMHDAGTWAIPYREDHFPYGIKTKAEFAKRSAAFFASFAEFSLEIESIIAEGDRVAVEARSRGTGKNGAAFENVYHISFIMKDHKAFRVREYFDPFAALVYIGQLDRRLP